MFIYYYYFLIECNASGPDDNMNAIVEKVGTILTSLREDSSAVDRS